MYPANEGISTPIPSGRRIGEPPGSARRRGAEERGRRAAAEKSPVGGPAGLRVRFCQRRLTSTTPEPSQQARGDQSHHHWPSASLSLTCLRSSSTLPFSSTSRFWESSAARRLDLDAAADGRHQLAALPAGRHRRVDHLLRRVVGLHREVSSLGQDSLVPVGLGVVVLLLEVRRGDRPDRSGSATRRTPATGRPVRSTSS